MTADAMLSVADALAAILSTAPQALPEEDVALASARGRTLRRDLLALRTQPPLPVSAMDGYAVRAADLARAPVDLRVIGTSQAGRAFDGAVQAGEAVRIFTGAPVPDGADTVLMQENASLQGATMRALQAEQIGRHVRAAGLDFSEGDVGLRAGRRLGAAELALAAAMNHASLPVARRPRVAILATGDELVSPGMVPGPSQIVASNSFALAAIVEQAGGLPIDLGIAGDNFEALSRGIRAASDQQADLLITLGGASVGDLDLVQSALVREGLELGFWRVAMRPGKPLMHGKLGAMRVLGLPGNPVSSIVCGILFVRPLIRALCGDPDAAASIAEPARLAVDLPANDRRQDYVRATLALRADDLPLAHPATLQDSSMLKVLAGAQCLIVREPHAPAARAGDRCMIIRHDRYL
ncbi:gephyrin-like molybdotransferase Glp [Lichenihabitans psoromatis]|uniref:molybdopterin molybdotransferase MoeA n=1 Tax=Lichenihabitans psoromatis TaxID=2528642 RepID=UPI001036E8F7|nr:gephyrin-like molybdotransferase Glp [Lichenihabitans psoromatis]